MKQKKKQILFSTIFVLAICILLIFLCVIGLTKINEQQTQKTEDFLSQMSDQYTQSIQRQVRGDIETLQGMAAFISGQTVNITEMMDILEKENMNNRFIRMGFITTDYDAYIVDINGQRYDHANLQNIAYLREVFAGNSIVTDTISDSLSNGWINIYAVPVYQDDIIIGALCAINDSNTFASIVDLPGLGNGYAHIVDSNGRMIIRSNKAIYSEINNLHELVFENDAQREQTFVNLKNNTRGAFTFTKDGKEYSVSYAPLGINDWFIASVVDSSVISNSLQTISHVGIAAILVIILCLFSLLLYIVRIIRNSQISLENLAYYDALTHSYTRGKFIMEAEKRLHVNRHASIVLFDVENFKFINELFGYENGDALLSYIAEILKQHIHKGEIFYRDNNDCFGALLYEQDTQILCQRLEDIMEHINTYELQPDQHYHIVCNCGVKVIDPSKNDSMSVLLDRAKLSLKQAKEETAGNHIAFFGDTLYKQMQQRNEIEQEMENALLQEEFKVYLQPKYSLQNNHIIGAEALIRWQHKGNILPPDSFIPIFEQNGFITKLDMYVLEKVCGYLKKWDEEGYRLSINVNQTRLLFYRENYLEMITSILKRYDIDPSRIVLEVTETMAVEELETLMKVTQKLHACGFLLSMDDFGSGYSSLNALQSLNFDELKLDRLFLDESSHDVVKQQKIIKKIIELAHDLSIRTVSEGVETKEQADFLRQAGCDIAQGYYFARPMPVDDFEQLLKDDYKRR